MARVDFLTATRVNTTASLHNFGRIALAVGQLRCFPPPPHRLLLVELTHKPVQFEAKSYADCMMLHEIYVSL